MFFKYRIMKKLEFGKYVSVETVCGWFPERLGKKIGIHLIELVGAGFLDRDSKDDVSLKRFSSLHEYKVSLGKQLFQITVSVSAIIVAVTGVAEFILKLYLLQQP